MSGKIASFFMQLLNLNIKPDIIDHNKFLGKKFNESDIYDKKSNGYFFSPMEPRNVLPYKDNDYKFFLI